MCTNCPGHFLIVWCREFSHSMCFFVKVTSVMLVTTGSETDRFKDLPKEFCVQIAQIIFYFLAPGNFHIRCVCFARSHQSCSSQPVQKLIGLSCTINQKLQKLTSVKIPTNRFRNWSVYRFARIAKLNCVRKLPRACFDLFGLGNS